MSVHDANYKQIKKALSVPEEEPIFVLRGQDVFAVPILQRYVNFASAIDSLNGNRPNQEWFDHMQEIIEEFVTWQNKNHVKVPD